MIKTVATNRYEKELKLMIKRGKDLNKLDYLLEILEANINKKIEHHLLLPEKYYLHKLIGKYKYLQSKNTVINSQEYQNLLKTIELF